MLLPLHSSIHQISLFPVVALGLGQLSSVIHQMIPRLMHISWLKKTNKKNTKKTKKHLLATTKQRTKTTKAVGVILTITSRKKSPQNSICPNHRSDLNHFYLLEFLLNSFTVSLLSTKFFLFFLHLKLSNIQPLWCKSFLMLQIILDIFDLGSDSDIVGTKSKHHLLRWWQPSGRSNFWEVESAFRRKFPSKFCKTQAATLSTNYVIWSKLPTSSNITLNITPLQQFCRKRCIGLNKVMKTMSVQ